ncbi:MAG TPA: glycosyltransferase family 2 protein, partial [Cytophagaceae bacterium]
KTLEALSWCNEIVVVDSGSTDGTQEICRKLGCKMVDQPFLGYGLQKQKGIENATHDWVLSVDADEVVTRELREEILKYFSSPLNVSGFYIPITMVFMGKQFKHGAESGKLHLRLFNRSKGGFTNATVHEQVKIDAHVGTLKNAILHYSYRSVEHYFEKFNQYTSNGAKELFLRGKRKNIFATSMRIPFTFIKIYFFQGCILNGFPGFVWSVFSAYYPFVKYVKLHALHKAKQNYSFNN